MAESLDTEARGDHHSTQVRYAAVGCLFCDLGLQAKLTSKLIQACARQPDARSPGCGEEGLHLQGPGQCVEMGCICAAVTYIACTLGQQIDSGTMPEHISMMLDHRVEVLRCALLIASGHALKYRPIQAPSLCTAACFLLHYAVVRRGCCCKDLDSVWR